MVRGVLRAILAMASLPALSGCGSFFNCLAADKAGPRQEQEVGKIYGGVLFECQAVESLFAGPWSPTWIEPVCVACLLAVDFPLTLVGDTLTLPYTIRYTLECRGLASDQKKHNLASDADSASRIQSATD
jgi:uncharacterized protein YceK